MRELKHHEKKLLKKVNFFEWKREKNLREVGVLRRYHIQDREDYHAYNKLCGYITKLTSMLRGLKADDPFRIKMTEQLLDKLYFMGLINKKSTLEICEEISAATFCRRRLATQVVMNKFCKEMRDAVSYVEQGNIRVGPDVVTQPAFHVTREMQDTIGWAKGSSIERTVREFNKNADDFELLGA